VTLETAARFYAERATLGTVAVKFLPSPSASAEVNQANARQWQRWAAWLREHKRTVATATEADAVEFAQGFQGRAKTWSHYRATACPIPPSTSA
jgi:hypothetical protein